MDTSLYTINETPSFSKEQPETSLKNRYPNNLLISSRLEDGKKISNVYITEVIIEQHVYIPLYDLLLSATANDEIYIYIHTVGGSVFTCTNIVDAMVRCKGHITTIATGINASCGAIILTYGHTIKCLPFAKIMFHSTSQLAYGKSLDIQDNVHNTLQYIKKMMVPAIEKGILTKEEYLKIFDEKLDVYISADELQNRLKRAA